MHRLKKSTKRFHITAEKPEDLIPRLGKGELHWKKGRSAYELSHAWMAADGLPPTVRKVLAPVPGWCDGQLIDAFFERETNLRTTGWPSQTDLLVLMKMKDGNGVIAVEGKVDEPFGEIVTEWLGAGPPYAPTRLKRLEGLCGSLGLGATACEGLYYQLLHRTAAALYEAQRYGFPRALMLVHSFSSDSAWFPEFAQFAAAMGMPVAAPNGVSEMRVCEGVELRLGWVSDTSSP